jgi:hypothetical protein
MYLNKYIKYKKKYLNITKLLGAGIVRDSTYYYSNQKYEDIDNKITELLDLKSNKDKQIALFIGEGNIFNLLPTLQLYVSKVILIDHDPSLIEWKKHELEAYKTCNTVDEFYQSIITYVGKINTDYIDTKFQYALLALKLAYRLPTITEEKFKIIKQACNTVYIQFEQINIMDTNNMNNLVDKITENEEKIIIVNRTNLMEYGTPHMQIKFFKNLVPQFNGILDNLDLLPFDKEDDVIVLFGISEQKYEQTYVCKGWKSSLQIEKDMIEKNKKYHEIIQEDRSSRFMD